MLTGQHTCGMWVKETSAEEVKNRKTKNMSGHRSDENTAVSRHEHVHLIHLVLQCHESFE